MTCQCNWCKKQIAQDEIIARGDVAELKLLIGELRNDLCCAEEDNSYYKAIHDGSWPTALDSGIDIIRRVLERRMVEHQATCEARP